MPYPRPGDTHPGPQPQPQATAPTPVWTTTRVVGRPQTRVDAYARVSGSATYTLDVSAARACFTRRSSGARTAHAVVKKVDLARALTMPGVVAVLSGDDKDAALPWYDEADKGAQSRLFDPHCRYAGEEVAAVAAETPYQAADALRQVAVEYDVQAVRRGHGRGA